MGATSGPYHIRRLALQLEMTDGRIMTVYADERNAAGAEVTITKETEPAARGGFWHPMATAPPITEISIEISRLGGYVMTLRNPADAPAWITEARKGIEQ